jgi:phospholipid/cholesterol/gamma-HCH transport system substrate-binding protein
MARSRKHEIGVGMLVLGAFGLLAWMSLKVGALQGLGDHVTVQVRLPDAMGLDQGALVKVAGVSVGTVEQITVDHDTAVLRVALDEDASIRSDVGVQVRARSLLGEKYLELSPASKSAPLLVDNDMLVSVQRTTEVDQLVNGIGPLVAALDPVAVNEAMAALSVALKEDPERAARMLANLDTILDNGARVSAELPGLVERTQATLDEVRGATRAARPVLSNANTAILRADAAVEKLGGAAEDLPATLSRVDALVVETHAAVQDGRSLLTRVDGNGDQIEQILSNLSEIDKWELRRLLREEGVVVRLRGREVVETE